jgi:hypothetical protein
MDDEKEVEEDAGQKEAATNLNSNKNVFLRNAKCI